MDSLSACFLRSHSPPLLHFSFTFALLIGIPIEILHQFPTPILLLPTDLFLSGPMRTPVKLPTPKQLHLFRIESLSLLSRGIFVVLLVEGMEGDGLQLGLQHLDTLGLASRQSLRLLSLGLGFVAGIQLQALLIVEDQSLEGHLGSGLVGLVENDGPTVLQAHLNNFISLPSEKIAEVTHQQPTYLHSSTPIIFSRPVLYNKIKMRREKHRLGMALLVLLVVMGSCETMGNSPYPSYSQVASIGNGPDMSALGVGNVGMGAESNNTASLPYDSKALDDLSRMINELLASMNKTDPPSASSSSGSQDNGNSGQGTPATTTTTPTQNTLPPASNKVDVKPDSSSNKPAPGTSSSQSANTQSGSTGGIPGTTSSGGTTGSNKLNTPSPSAPSTPSSSGKSNDTSGKTTSSQTITQSSTTTISNKNTQTATTITSTTTSTTNKNNSAKPTSAPPSTPPTSQSTSATPSVSPVSDPSPSAPATPAKPNSSSSSSTDPLFSFQDYLSTIFSPVNTDSTKSSSGDLNFGFSDGGSTVSDGSATYSDSNNTDTNINTDSQAQTQTQAQTPPPKDPPAPSKPSTPAPTSPSTSSTSSKSATKKTDTKASSSSSQTTNLSTSQTSSPSSSTPSSSPPDSSTPSATPLSPSKSTALCVSDEQCRNDYGSFVADGLMLTCSPTLGVCTYS